MSPRSADVLLMKIFTFFHTQKMNTSVIFNKSIAHYQIFVHEETSARRISILKNSCASCSGDLIICGSTVQVIFPIVLAG